MNTLQVVSMVLFFMLLIKHIIDFSNVRMNNVVKFIYSLTMISLSIYIITKIDCLNI